jgi:hypothetical protein
MKIKALAKSVYGLFGTAFLIVGATVMLFHTGLLPGSVQNLIMGIAHSDPNTLHIMQEFASILVFAGLVSIWFVRHYEDSKLYHWAMTAFWALFAVAHWVDGREGPRSVSGPMIDTIPFLLFLLIGLLRWNSERQFSSEASK